MKYLIYLWAEYRVKLKVRYSTDRLDGQKIRNFLFYATNIKSNKLILDADKKLYSELIDK
jgi:hypothetical protein